MRKDPEKIMRYILIGLCLAGILCGCAEKKEVTFDKLLDAIAWVESKGNIVAFNAEEDAAGLFQIRPIYLRDVNRILGYDKYTLEDRYNPEKSREMVKVYLNHYAARKTLKAIARIHNGGPRGDEKQCTLKYWEKVKEYF